MVGAIQGNLFFQGVEKVPGSSWTLPARPHGRQHEDVEATGASHLFFPSFRPKGVTVTVAPDVPFVLSLESNQHFCLGSAGVPLQYLLCISSDVATAHRHVGTQLVEPARVLPDTALLG